MDSTPPPPDSPPTDLFGDALSAAAPPTRAKSKPAPPNGAGPGPASTRGSRGGIKPCEPLECDLLLAAQLPAHLRLGCSTWSYPGWQGLVWAGRHGESLLSRSGLSAYAAHPLLRAVSVDRGFYRALTVSQCQALAQQVPADFRFSIKAPSLVCDAQVRDETGRPRTLNPAFLDPALSLQEFVGPVLEGLGTKAGAFVFQLSPLPPRWLGDMREPLERLHRLLRALPRVADRAPDARIAVEVRDPQWLTPDFAALLRDTGSSYCLGLHPRLPPLEQQLPLLRALWPGPLICRWNLHRSLGPQGYEDAQRRYGEYDTLLDPDPDTRAMLARVACATAKAGQSVQITVSNHAEGCAPLSVRALAQALAAPDT